MSNQQVSRRHEAHPYLTTGLVMQDKFIKEYDIEFGPCKAGDGHSWNAEYTMPEDSPEQIAEYVRTCLNCVWFMSHLCLPVHTCDVVSSLALGFSHWGSPMNIRYMVASSVLVAGPRPRLWRSMQFIGMLGASVLRLQQASPLCISFLHAH